MQGGDIDLIKDIPGYKIILKAVLRGQIQYLVEQLADHTGEESVILTASVSDGSLSHLGSESGKVFLQDHDDIKSQFLGFCLKRYHNQQQPETDQLGLSTVEQNPISAPTPRFGGPRHFSGSKPRNKSTPLHMGPRGSHFTSPAVHPVTMTNSTPRVALGNALRHKPYNTNRPAKAVLRSNQTAKTSKTNSIEEIKINPNEVIKIEAADLDEESQSDARSEKSEASNDSELRSMDASQIQAAMVSLPLHNIIPSTSATETVQAASYREDSAENSRSSISNAGDTQYPENSDIPNFNIDSDKSDIAGGSADEFNANASIDSADLNGSQKEITGTSDKPSVKVEPVSEAEMDLEIIGIEPGIMSQGQGHMSEGDNNWIPNVQTRLGLGASTSGVQQGDITGIWKSPPLKKPRKCHPSEQKSGGKHKRLENAYRCGVCGVYCTFLRNLRRHMFRHTGEKPHKCKHCQKSFARQDALKRHLDMRHMN